MILDKAFDILELYLSNPGEHNVRELSELSGINLSTVNRIVSKLFKRDYLRKTDKRGYYSLSMKFLDFSSIVKNKLLLFNIAYPFLSKLSKEIEESILLINWDGRKAIHISTVSSSHVLRVVPEEGTIMSLYGTAAGKAILATMTDKELKNYLETTPFISRTYNTVASVADLENQLLIVKREGVAFEDEEQIIGVKGMAVVIKNHFKQAIGAVSIVGPSIRLSRPQMREFITPLKKTSLEISKALGYPDCEL